MKITNIHSKTDKGLLRKNNEDYALSLYYPWFSMLLVCDGVGGSRKGEVCSSLCGKITKDFLDNLQEKDIKDDNRIVKTLHKLFSYIKKNIEAKQYESEEFKDMASTYTLALVFENKTFVLHIGDSACYKFYQPDKLIKITYSDNLLNFVGDNKVSDINISDEKMKNTLVSAVGLKTEYNPHIYFFDNDYDKLLLCTDGLFNMLTENEISDILNMKLLTTKIKCDKLINNANQNGGKDNIGICLMEVE